MCVHIQSLAPVLQKVHGHGAAHCLAPMATGVGASLGWTWVVVLRACPDAPSPGLLENPHGLRRLLAGLACLIVGLAESPARMKLSGSPAPPSTAAASSRRELLTEDHWSQAPAKYECAPPSSSSRRGSLFPNPSVGSTLGLLMLAGIPLPPIGHCNFHDNHLEAVARTWAIV